MSPIGVKAYKALPKPLGLRIQELIQSLQVIRDALQAIRQGKLHQFVPLYGQMRSLLTEKSKKSKPLLVAIANALGKELELYCMPDTEDGSFPESLRKGLVLHLSGFPLSLHQELPAQKRLPIGDFLDQRILMYKEARYSVRDIIELLANKAGGSHYSPDYPRDFAELMTFGLNGQPMLSHALFQIGEAAFQIGLKLLRTVANTELHLHLAIPKQDVAGEAFILDSAYPGSRMRFFVLMNRGYQLHLGIRGIQGFEARLGNEVVIDLAQPHHFAFKVGLTDELETELSIVTDGIETARRRVPAPLFLVNDPLNYNTYVNRSQDSESAGCVFGLALMLQYGGEQSVGDRASVFHYMRERTQDKDAPCVAFRPGTFGHAPRGTKALTMTGRATKTTVAKVLSKGLELWAAEEPGSEA